MDYNTARAKILAEFDKFNQAAGIYQDDLRLIMRGTCIANCFGIYADCDDTEDLRDELLNLILGGPD